MLLLDAASIKSCYRTEGTYNLEQATKVCNDQKGKFCCLIHPAILVCKTTKEITGVRPSRKLEPFIGVDWCLNAFGTLTACEKNNWEDINENRSK